MDLVQNTVKDEERNITYHVMSPAKMTPEQAVKAVQYFLGLGVRKKNFPKPNAVYVITARVGVRGMGTGR